MKTKNQLLIRTVSINFGRLILFFFTIVLFTLSSCSPNEELRTQSESNLMLNRITEPGTPELLASLPSGGMGSAIGPEGDLFVTQSGAGGSILRINKKTGSITTFVSRLPTSVVPIGGVFDVTFIDETTYALVTLVGPFFGDNNINGIYRIDSSDSCTIIADIGQFALDNQPTGFDYAITTGLQYAIEVYHGGFLVTDGHHNRMYHVTLEGEVTEFKTFDNIVPSGLAVRGNSIYMTEAGTTVQFYGNSKIVSIDSKSLSISDVATGVPFLVDVEFNRGRTLFAISQGEWAGGADGDATEPNTGSLLKVNSDGTFTVIAEGLNRPTSLEFIQNTAYLVTLTGEI
ncbi:ScyD/ScyE family protein [Formosa maritima]|uniref:ScyD/ScyE family protein n=1 Tax=Formosa maritima TaxID=2592046 RepID=A0A5D0GBN5_9FLAO|nr:ScyD/ScyE family protein [Formosa maritima]TYA55182.1 ScyD/ScyE family protein [Formosa maritima]